jgi:hypothetical protein
LTSNAVTAWTTSHPRRPAEGSSPAPAVLYAVLDGLGRYLAGNVVPVAAVFQPDVETWIRAAYARAATRPAAWVRVVTIRDSLDGIPREVLDDTLDRMVDRPDVRLMTEPDVLTDDDPRAAVDIGGEKLHLWQIG